MGKGYPLQYMRYSIIYILLLQEYYCYNLSYLL